MINEVKLKDVCDLFSAGDKPHQFSEVETPQCSIPVYGNGKDDNGLVGYTNKARIMTPAVTLAARGSSCGVAFYRDKPYTPIVRLISLVAKPMIDTKYLYYQIINRHFSGGGSGQPQITIPDIADATMFMETDLLLQKKISSVLFTIDLKISNNLSICSDLDSLAKHIYNYWFIQFDFPDRNGKPYKSNGGKMKWNETIKREIPEDWEVIKLGELIKYKRGISYTGKDLGDTGTPIISLASIDRSGRYIPDGIKYYNKEYPSSKVLQPYDLVMANTDMTQERAVMGKIIFVPDIFDGDVLSTHHITQIQIRDEMKAYLMLTSQTKWFHEYIKGFSSGTNVLGMDMIGYDDYAIVCPTKSILDRFNITIYDIYKNIFNIYRENQQLSGIREFLLPMLMNGQIKVE